MFVEELRARRAQAGLLQREFAVKAHVSLSSVKQYEAGKKKPERKFATWCDDFYGCPGTFERLYDGMIAESYPSWFGPRVLSLSPVPGLTVMVIRDDSRFALLACAESGRGSLGSPARRGSHGCCS
ncbi:MAG: helix-turn-helix domain-containing protein [Streptosporangiaceae bacterium]